MFSISIPVPVDHSTYRHDTGNRLTQGNLRPLGNRALGLVEFLVVVTSQQVRRRFQFGIRDRTTFRVLGIERVTNSQQGND